MEDHWPNLSVFAALMVWALNWLQWPSTDNPKKFIDLGNSPGSCLQVCHVLDSSEKTRAHDVKNTYVCIYTKLHNYVCIHVYIYICTWYHIIYSYIIYILYIHMFVYIYIYVYMYVYLFAASIMQVVLIYPSTWSPGHHHSSHWAVWDYIYMYKCRYSSRNVQGVCGKSNPTFRSDCSETLHFASILKESESDIEKDIHFAVSLPVWNSSVCEQTIFSSHTVDGRNPANQLIW